MKCAHYFAREAGFLVRGNHDAYVTGELQPDPTKLVAYQLEWTRSNIEAGHLQWLTGLPIGLEFKWGSLQLTIRHADLWDEETYMYPDSKCLLATTLQEGEILAIGHTHRPMQAKAGKGVILDPGSIGQPHDWNPQ